jgi:hypothetical protein
MNSMAVSAFHFLVMGVAIVASLAHVARFFSDSLSFLPSSGSPSGSSAPGGRWASTFWASANSLRG